MARAMLFSFRRTRSGSVKALGGEGIEGMWKECRATGKGDLIGGLKERWVGTDVKKLRRVQKRMVGDISCVQLVEKRDKDLDG